MDVTDAARELRRDVSYQRYLRSDLAARGARWISAVALTLLVVRLEGASASALVIATLALPALLRWPVTAVTARWSWATVTAVTDLFAAVSLATVPLVTARGSLGIWQVLGVATIAQLPAARRGGRLRHGLDLRRLVGRDLMGYALVDLKLWNSIVVVAAPLIAALLAVTVVDPAYVLLAATCCLLVAAASILLVRLELSPASTDPLLQVRAALSEAGVARVPDPPALLGTSLLHAFAGAGLLALTPGWLQRYGLASDDARLVLVVAALGAGYVTGSAIIDWLLGRGLPASWVALLFVPLSVLGSVLVALAPSWIVVAIAAFAWMACYSCAGRGLATHALTSQPELQLLAVWPRFGRWTALGWLAGALGAAGVRVLAGGISATLTVIISGAVATIWYGRSPLARR